MPESHPNHELGRANEELALFGCDAARQAGLGQGAAVLGVEFRSLPHAISALLRAEFRNITLVDAGPALQQARMIKTEREIELLRRAVRIGDIGHIALAELVHEAGRNEF